MSTSVILSVLRTAYLHVNWYARMDFMHVIWMSRKPLVVLVRAYYLTFFVPVIQSRRTYHRSQRKVFIKMAWRNQGITGSNNIPLGSRRRMGGSDSVPPADDEAYNPNHSSAGLADGGYKRGRSPERGMYYPFRTMTGTHDRTAAPVENGERRRKKRNRWGDAAENKAAGLMGLPTMIKAHMTNEQLEAYTLHLRIQEISEKLRINDVIPADGDRYVLHSHILDLSADLPNLDLHHLLRNMTTSVVVSIHASIATANVLKTSATSKLKRR